MRDKLEYIFEKFMMFVTIIAITGWIIFIAIVPIIGLKYLIVRCFM